MRAYRCAACWQRHACGVSLEVWQTTASPLAPQRLMLHPSSQLQEPASQACCRAQVVAATLVGVVQPSAARLQRAQTGFEVAVKPYLRSSARRGCQQPAGF